MQASINQLIALVTQQGQNITDIKGSVTTLQTTITQQINQQTTTIITAINTQGTSITQVNNSIAGLQNIITSALASTTVSNINNVLNLILGNGTSSGILNQIQTSIATIQKTIDANNSALVTSIQTILNNQNVSSTQLTQILAWVNGMNGITAEKFTSLTTQLTNIQNTIGNPSDNQTISNILLSLQQQIVAQGTAITNNANSISQALSTITQTLVQNTSDISSINETLTSISSSIADLTTAVGQVTTFISSFPTTSLNNFLIYVDQAGGLQDSIKSIAINLANIDSTTTNTARQVTTLIIEQTTLAKSITNKIDSCIKQMNAKFDALNTKIDNNQTNISKALYDINADINTVIINTGDTGSINTSIQALTKTIINNVNIGMTQEQYNTIMQEISSIPNSVTSVTQGQITAMQKTVLDTLGEQIGQIATAQNTNFTQILDLLNTMKGTSTTEIQGIMTTIEVITTSIESISAQIVDINSSISSTISTTIQNSPVKLDQTVLDKIQNTYRTALDIQTVVNGLASNSGTSSITAAITNAQNHIEQYINKNVVTLLKTINDNVNSISLATTALTANVNTANTNITNINDKVTSIQNALNSYIYSSTESLTNINSQLTNFATNGVNISSSSLQTIKSNISTIVSSISSTLQNIQTNGVKIDQSSLTQINQAITASQKNITNIINSSITQSTTIIQNTINNIQYNTYENNFFRALLVDAKNVYVCRASSNNLARELSVNISAGTQTTLYNNSIYPVGVTLNDPSNQFGIDYSYQDYWSGHNSFFPANGSYLTPQRWDVYVTTAQQKEQCSWWFLCSTTTTYTTQNVCSFLVGAAEYTLNSNIPLTDIPSQYLYQNKTKVWVPAVWYSANNSPSPSYILNNRGSLKICQNSHAKN